MEKLIIMGRGNGWQDIKWEIGREVWAVLSVYGSYKKADRYFDIHKMDNKALNRYRDMIPDDLLFTADLFPHEYIINRFGPVFHSSVSWLLGYAAIMGYTDIKIIGVNMEHGSEYGDQRDSFFYLYGYLSALGIKIEIPQNSGVYLSKKLYGGYNG